MSNEAFTVKRVLDLNRGIGLLTDRDMLLKMSDMNLSTDVRELVELGLANVAATEALEKRIAEHQAAYDATLPLRIFQTYESVYSGDGDPEPDVLYGCYEARTEKQAVKLAHEHGETQVTNARLLNQSDFVAGEARKAGYEIIDLALSKAKPEDLRGIPLPK